MKIRQATRKDIPAIAGLATKTFIDAWGHTFTFEKLKQRIEEARSVSFYNRVFDKDKILLAEENSQLIGYVQFGKVTFEWQGVTHEDQEIQRLYVLSDYQRKGIGKALLEKAFSDPRLINARNIYLDVWSKNLEAQNLYRSYGFKEIGILGNEVIMMRKNV
jgi:diamine N-acetyltransferase